MNNCPQCNNYKYIMKEMLCDEHGTKRDNNIISGMIAAYIITVAFVVGFASIHMGFVAAVTCWKIYVIVAVYIVFCFGFCNDEFPENPDYDEYKPVNRGG